MCDQRQYALNEFTTSSSRNRRNMVNETREKPDESSEKMRTRGKAADALCCHLLCVPVWRHQAGFLLSFSWSSPQTRCFQPAIDRHRQEWWEFCLNSKVHQENSWAFCPFPPTVILFSANSKLTLVLIEQSNKCAAADDRETCRLWFCSLTRSLAKRALPPPGCSLGPDWNSTNPGSHQLLPSDLTSVTPKHFLSCRH